jgi:hypothetical protein
VLACSTVSFHELRPAVVPPPVEEKAAPLLLVARPLLLAARLVLLAAAARVGAGQ